MQVAELLRENSFRAGGRDGVIVQNNPVNFIDPFGLEKTSSCPDKDRCITTCIETNYGDMYSWASSLSPFSVASLVADQFGNEVARSLKQTGTKNTYSNYSKGSRQLNTLNQFNKFNTAMAVVGAGAAGFQLGAYGYCYVECFDK